MTILHDDLYLKFSKDEIARCRAFASRYRTSALDQADQNGNYRQNQENVNKSTQRVRANHTQQPQDQKQNGYCPEHKNSFLYIPPTATCTGVYVGAVEAGIQ
jgi:dTDP-4-dehydrorhamnose 3,5-epimerase-like enzyme